MSDATALAVSDALAIHESAQTFEELSRAGVSTADILGGGLASALTLASAGGLETGRAANVAATALAQFSLTAE